MRRANWLSVARVGDRPPARACRVRAPAAWAMAMAVAGVALSSFRHTRLPNRRAAKAKQRENARVK